MFEAVISEPLMEVFRMLESPVVLIIIFVVWNIATTYTQQKWMRKNMVTKKDLQIAAAEITAALKEWAEDRFVTQRECTNRIVGLKGGSRHAR